MPQRIQVRKGTAAAWTAATPVLASGEIGFETDTGKLKIGDGVTAWTSLPYFGAAADLAAHLTDTTDAHDASAVSYAGSTNLAATDVEAALDELDTEKLASARAACRVKRVAAYSFTNNAVTAIPWDGEWYDTHGFHDNATNNTRLTIPASAGAGLYSMRGVWVPDGPISAGVRVLCRIKVNGVEVGGTEIEGGGVYASPAFALDHNLSVGDYVEFCSFVAGSGSTPLNLANTTFSIRKVGTV